MSFLLPSSPHKPDCWGSTLAQTAAIEDALKAELQQPASPAAHAVPPPLPAPDAGSGQVTNIRYEHPQLDLSMESVPSRTLGASPCRHLAALEKRGSRSVRGHMPLAPNQQQAGDDMNPGSARNR